MVFAILSPARISKTLVQGDYCKVLPLYIIDSKDQCGFIARDNFIAYLLSGDQGDAAFVCWLGDNSSKGSHILIYKA